MKTGKYVKKMRLQKKLSQEQLGKLINKPGVRVSEWESDHYSIKLSTFMEIANVLNIKDFNKLFNN